MRGFTARINTDPAPVRINFADDGSAIVKRNGTVLAHGIPEVVPRATDDGRLVAFSTAVWEGRTAISVDTPTAHAEDVAIARTSTIFVAEGVRIGGFGVLWGARLEERFNRVKGWAYADGVATLETWAVELVPAPRRCCGKTGPPPSPTIDLPALAWPA